MKKNKCLIAVIIIMSTYTTNVRADYAAEYKDKILSKIIPSYALATVTEDCVLSERPGLVSLKAGELKKGVVVEILQDSSEKWYKVEMADEDISGWVNHKYLNIHPVATALQNNLSDSEVEDFANIMSFPSGTSFFIWTDVARQKTHVLKKAGDKYSLLKTFECSTGINTAPTTRGFFTVSDRGKWFFSKRFESGAMYWVRFNGSYLFHSVAMDKNKNIIDNNLGERRSNGCVRLGVDDAKWIFDNIPNKTTVFIH